MAHVSQAGLPSIDDSVAMTPASVRRNRAGAPIMEP